jgi:hypothetical protein
MRVLLLFAALLLPAPQPAAPRASAPGTAVIRGRVTAGDTGAPLARAIVRLIPIQGNGVDTRTNAEGQYAFTALPSGRYSVRVESPEFIATYASQIYIDTASAGSSRIDLKDRETRANVNIALPRAFAISGRIVDDVGEPVAGVEILMKREDESMVYGAYRRRTSDDTGAFRVFGLMPGRYIVCARPPASMDFHSGPSRQRDRLTATCYPSTAAETDARPVTIKGTDVGGIEIRLLRSRSYTISGIVLDSTGAPVERPMVSISRFEKNGSSGTGTSGDPDGRFTIRNLASGRYAISAEIGGPDRPEQQRDLEIAYVPLTLDAADVEGLVLTLTKSVSVAGRLVFEEGAIPPARNGPPIFVRAVPDGDNSGGMGGERAAYPGSDLTFRLDKVFGRRTIAVVNMPTGWMHKSVSYKGKDATDVPVELTAGTDPRDLEIVLSNRGAIVSGTVVDERGRPTRARVLMIPADRARWRSLLTAESAASSPAGIFRLAPQRSGDYVIVAVSATDPVSDVQDARFFERILASGRSITVTENDRRTIDLTLTQLSEALR